jgi:formylglycine-generating enzyme required for sulfatase activity
MQRIVWMAFVLLVAALGAASAAQAQKRVAFVVGTDKYDNLDKTKQLQRAVNDARAVGAAFKALGFEVVAAENLTRGQFNSEWQRFLDKLSAGDTAAIYYAGHGVEIEGLNFLLPRDIPDIKFGRQEQIKRESLSLAEILLDLRTRSPEIALVILDACRDNPLMPDEMRSAGTRSGGLAPLKGEPPKGTFIMYSAGAGESALDRLPGNDPDPRNSIFTRKLLPLLGVKGLALHDLARQLRADVLQLASTVPHTQRPAYYDGVIGRYCLAGCEAAAEAPRRAEPSSVEGQLSEAARTWETLRHSANVADLEAFATRYLDTYFAGLAKVRIEDLKRTQTMSKAAADAERRALQSIAKYNEFLKRMDAEATTEIAKPSDGLKPGVVFRDCPNCPDMVVVPAGDLLLGSPAGEEGRSGDEGPQRKVTIARPFAVGKFEVTFTEWEACVNGSGCAANKNPSDSGWGRSKRPVIDVTWHHATQYAAWLSRTTDKAYRLLTEAEWEYAARGATNSSALQTPFATGATVIADQANYNSEYAYSTGKTAVKRGKTIEVGSFPGNAFGLHDLHGNVWEWVQDCYKDTYVGVPTDGSAVTSTECSLRVVRGGSWLNYPWYLRSASRGRYVPTDRFNIIGFRVARTLNP